MRERPILFSTPMVQAILEGRKTVTRRVLNRDKLYNGFAFDDPRIARSCPYGQPGDRLWVRETWALVPRTAYAGSVGVQQTLRPDDNHDAAIYRAGWDRVPPGPWRPSIFMPRWASRITLEVTFIAVSELHRMGEVSAKAEGVTPKPVVSATTGQSYLSHCAAFADLWDKINAKRGYSWESNPWVFVIGFKRIES